VEQEYVVEVSGQMVADGLMMLNQSFVFNGKPVPALKVSWQNETRLRFAFKGGSSRLIAFVCEKVGLTVVSVRRIRMGRVPLASLALGQWRYLLGYERF
jgi:23S rRNA pseudouridine2604 synthase